MLHQTSVLQMKMVDLLAQVLFLHLQVLQVKLLLQVWCGILTVVMVVIAALLISIKPKSTEGGITTLKPDNVSPTGTVKTTAAPFKSIAPVNPSGPWQNSLLRCQGCPLVLRNNSIHCMESSIYFIFTQVTFSQYPEKNQTKSVILKRDATFGKAEMTLVEGIFPKTTQGSVWVAQIVSLKKGDSVSLDINTDDFRKDSRLTFWGAYKLH